MLAEGALVAGCRFFAGYPITPASEVYEVMMQELPARAGLALSAPDEISSLCYCVGASLRGLKAMTATSGPGWALMIETVQYALMTETPVVVALVQRLGPSTGGATQGAQGDVWLAEFSTSGGYTLPVFSPSNASECFELAIHAFNWSERLRTPVVLLSDKEVGMTSEAIDDAALQIPALVDRKKAMTQAGYTPYEAAEPEGVPAFAAVGGEIKATVTGSAHDFQGRLCKNSPQVIHVLQRLQRKIEAHADEMALVKPDLDPEARTLLISYGVTARATHAAVGKLRSGGRRVSFLQVQSLFPVPRQWLERAAAGVDTVFVAEENLSGQYRAALTPYLPGKRIYGINRIGRLISPREIVEGVKGVMA
jgi:2-oxoglutarate ferredoxin oxidoreductase subunit alpha